MITLVTGGARSGKSSFGESLLRNEHKVLYVATSIAFDDEMKERVRYHRESRPSHWKTLEAYKDFQKNLLPIIQSDKYNGIILDCVTVMITNLLLEQLGEKLDGNYREAEKTILDVMRELIEVLNSFEGKTVLITNEVGAGIVPENKLAREFRDIAGRINQYLAAQCAEVYFVVSGIPMKIKG